MNVFLPPFFIGIFLIYFTPLLKSRTGGYAVMQYGQTDTVFLLYVLYNKLRLKVITDHQEQNIVTIGSPQKKKEGHMERTNF